jgi:hypothetical protein
MNTSYHEVVRWLPEDAREDAANRQYSTFVRTTFGLPAAPRTTINGREYCPLGIALRHGGDTLFAEPPPSAVFSILETRVGDHSDFCGYDTLIAASLFINDFDRGLITDLRAALELPPKGP